MAFSCQKLSQTWEFASDTCVKNISFKLQKSEAACGRRSANMQQIYRRAPMRKCYLNNFWNSTLVHGCSPVKLLYICRTTFAYGEIFLKNKVTNHKRNRIICLSCWRYFANNSKKPQACNFILKKILSQMFSCDFCEIFKNTYFFRTPLVAASEL